MTTTDLRPETGLGAFTLEHLDFTPEIPCEHSGHGVHPWHHGFAWGLVHRGCPNGCKPPRTLAICRGVWDDAGLHGLRCLVCGASGARAEFWSLVAVL